MSEMPWSDCKVAFGVDDIDSFRWWLERTNWGEGHLPEGWSICETDASGARFVVVCRVEGLPDPKDGEIVRDLFEKVSREYDHSLSKMRG